MPAGFAGLQGAENALVPGLIESSGVDWLVEMAPLISPSPAIAVSRHRMLFDNSGWVWPFRAPTAELPFMDEALPAILLRHVFQPSVDVSLFDEALRCLIPGGLLISVSANPWHRAAWRELGRAALQLPAWPQLLVRYSQHDLQLQSVGRQRWRGLIPGLSPILVVMARKPSRAAPVTRLRIGYPQVSSAPMPATQCRAA
ncbi:MAG: hypothetical protein AAF446_06235 [Pseudomonadota bacterium]